MKTIIEMAREVGIDWHRHWNDDESNRLERFAALVRADEREACAQICDDASWPKLGEMHSDSEWASKMLAVSIRARGNT